MKPPNYTRRHSRIHEVVFLNYFFQLLVSVLLFVFIAVVPDWGIFFYENYDIGTGRTLFGVIVSFAISLFAIKKFLRYPGAQSVSYILPTVSVVFIILVLIYFIMRLEYSNKIIILGFLFISGWSLAGYFYGNRYRMNRYAVVPVGDVFDFTKLKTNNIFEILGKPDLGTDRYNAVIADLRSNEMTPEWEKFLAHCTLSRIPVYHTKQIKESLTGRVKIDHLSENEFGALLPSGMYESFKRFIDLIAAFILLPFVVPFFFIIGAIIKLDSNGPVFFIQKRMGFRGRPFNMLKFRSMKIDLDGEKFTKNKKDPRITRIGKIIRKYRIDELPQIINIIAGQMSFIGPRPESLELSEWYEKDVPFFSYRHVVRPGISGWAQVEQGYAAEVDGMNIKLEYDFYYIKHFSFWLDTLITFKTIKTIFTGFGAR